MHELGIVFYIVRDVKAAAEANQVQKVHSVTVELGEVSGVVPEYLTDCWNWAAGKEQLLAGAELICEQEQAITWCDDCEEEYPTVQYGKTCPYCGSGNTWLLRGKDCTIRQITAE